MGASHKSELNSSLPDNLVKHFAASGLDETTLVRLQVAYVARHSDASIDMPVPAARIPYFDLDGVPTGFYRLRTLTDWIPDGDSKPRKYMQAAKTGNHLYLPPLLDVPWRAVAADVAIPLLITEGEKKAACACVHGFPTVGLGGVWNWRSAGAPIAELDLFIWRDRKVYLVFDSPDVRSNPNVTAALEHLATELRRRGATVRVAVLPCDDGRKVGLDDFLVRTGEQAFAQVLADASEHLDVISELNKQFAMVWIGAKALVMKDTQRADGTLDVDFAKPTEVKPGFAGQFVTMPGPNGGRPLNVFDYWMKHPRRRQYARVVFEPAGCQPDEYNLWRGFSVSPEAGDCSLYLDHIRDNICQGDLGLYTYVIAWMAHMVQRPGELPGTALVLRGQQGVGKGVFAHTLGALMQSHYLHLSSQRHLLSNFNGHTKDKLLFFADEAVWAGDKAAEGMLKALITEPTRMIEHKGRDALVVHNYTRLIVASNHDWVVPAGLDERRFVLLDVGTGRMQDTEYFGRLKAQMDRRGLSALLDYLQKVNLSSVNLRQIPKTAALLETKLLSLSSVQRFWFECLWEGNNGSPDGSWAREVPCASLHHYYSEHSAVSGQSRRAVESELGRALQRLVPGLRDVRHRGPGPGSSQQRHWVFPPLAECRRVFEAQLGQTVDWGAPDQGPTKAKRGKS